VAIGHTCRPVFTAEALPITVRHGVIDKSNEAVEIDSIDELPPTIGDVFVALG
jgi:hypothetical protein